MKIKTELFLADDWNDYELLDSGNGRNGRGLAANV